MYKYWGYGLTILSEIEFPEFLPFEFGQPDVIITLGKTPEHLGGTDVVKRVNVSMSPTEYLLNLVNVANYYANNGNSIIVEPQPGADDKSIRLFLLSNGMAAILHQRDIIPLHSSAIEFGESVVLICGKSGAGKSTTLKMLMQMGFMVFSDDVCVLRQSTKNKEKVEVVSSYPMIKLWEDSYAKLKTEIASEIYKIRPGLPKYAHFYHNVFIIEPKSVKAIFILERNNQINTPEIKKLGSFDAFNQLQMNSFRYSQLNGMKKRNIHFNLISQLAADAVVYKISRPEQGNSIKKVANFIESYLIENG